MKEHDEEFLIEHGMAGGVFDALVMELESRPPEDRAAFVRTGLVRRLGDEALDRVCDATLVTALAPWPPPQEPAIALAALFAAAEILVRGQPLPEAVDGFTLEDAFYDVAELTPSPWNAVLRGALQNLEEPVMDALTLPPKIGPYSVRRTVGEGGMGLVVECDAPQGEIVAVKVVKPTRCDEEALRRFQDEIRVLRRLDHPGIAPILDSGTVETTWGRVPWFAMPLVEGVPIDAAVRGFDTRRRLTLIRDLASAIHHAHQRGIIHRDLKPANILVSPEGRGVILDFGVAKLIDARERTSLRRTVGNMLVGTLAYMSPEQARGDPGAIDIRSDIYSIGAILFELLAGEPPVDLSAMGFVEALGKVQHSRPRNVSEIDPSLRGDVETIVATCLARDPDDRYASAAALAEDLTRHLDGIPITARRPTTLETLRRWVRHHRLLAGTVASVTLMLITLTIVAFRGWRSAIRERDARLQREQAAIGIAGSHLQSIRLLARLGASSNDRLQLLESYRGWFRGNEDGIRENPDFARTFADILKEFGSLEMEQGHLDRALPLRREALRIRETLAAADPDNASDQRHLSIAIVELGDVLKHQGHLAQAMDLYRRALAIDASLHRLHPREIGHLDDLSWSHERVGQLSLKMGRWEDYARHLVIRWKLSKELLDLDPERLLSLENRFEALHQFAALFDQLDFTDPRADRAWNEVLTLTRRLVRMRPKDPRQLRRLELAYIFKTKKAFRRGDLEEALRSCEQALAVREKINAQDPNSITDLLMFASRLRQRAQLEWEKEHVFPKATAEKLIALGRRTCALAPHDPRAWLHLATTYHVLTDFTPVGSPQREDFASRGLEIFAEGPIEGLDTRGVRALEASLLLDRRRPDDLRKGLRLIRDARKKFPETTDWDDLETRILRALGLPTERPRRREESLREEQRALLLRIVEDVAPLE